MNIWVPKFKVYEPSTQFEMKFGVAGYFKLETLNPYGRVKETTMWKQLITNTGLDAYASPATPATEMGETTCYVGTGTGTPAFTDTALGNSVGSSSSIIAATQSYNAGLVYHESATTYDFVSGSIVANLTEVGCGNGGSAMCYRDLIRDGGGSPTTFPVTVSDQLRVTHVKRLYLPSSDTTGSFTVTGAGSYDFTSRVANSGTFGTGNTDPWSIRPTVSSTVNGSIALGSKARIAQAVDISTLGAITTVMGGNKETNTSRSTSAYTPGSFQRDSQFIWGLTAANFVGGIGGLVFGSYLDNINPSIAFQVGLDPFIPKFASSIQRILTLNSRVSWDRV